MELFAIPPRRGALVVAAFAFAFGAGCSETPPITGAVEEEIVSSTIVGDDYLIQVRLPPGYDSESSALYPVVYQLDGTSFGPQFAITAGLASELEEADAIPKVIVVGIGYPYDDPLIDKRKGRMRDYVVDSGPDGPGGGDAFFQFLAEELVPRIDATYRTDPAQRVLCGHSLGGFFSLYVLLTTGRDETPLFAGYIAADPSLGLDDSRLLHEELLLRDQTNTLPRSLYFPIARYDGAVQQLFFEQLRERLTRYEGLRMETAVLDTDHGGTTTPGFREGLSFVLEGAR